MGNIIQIQQLYVERTSLGVLAGLPITGRCLESLTARLPQIFQATLEPLVILPEPREVKTGLAVYKNVPPPWMYAAVFDGNAVKDGDYAGLLAVWFGEQMTPDLDKVMGEVESKWATFAKDFYF